MSREEFIGKLEMVYVGDRNAFNDIVCAYDSLLVKNDKTVEYIKDIFKDEKWYENYEYNDLENALKNVLNILQNGSDEE